MFSRFALAFLVLAGLGSHAGASAIAEDRTLSIDPPTATAGAPFTVRIVPPPAAGAVVEWEIWTEGAVLAPENDIDIQGGSAKVLAPVAGPHSIRALVTQGDTVHTLRGLVTVLPAAGGSGSAPASGGAPAAMPASPASPATGVPPGTFDSQGMVEVVRGFMFETPIPAAGNRPLRLGSATDPRFNATTGTLADMYRKLAERAGAITVDEAKRGELAIAAFAATGAESDEAEKNWGHFFDAAVNERKRRGYDANIAEHRAAYFKVMVEVMSTAKSERERVVDEMAKELARIWGTYGFTPGFGGGVGTSGRRGLLHCRHR
jgi:hypothetical protein